MKQVLNLASGYRRETVFEEFSPDKILNNRENYTKAVKKQGETYLSADYVICPFCGARTSVHGRVNETVSNEQVMEWADSQVSLFEDEGGEEIHLAAKVKVEGNIRCAVCERILQPECGFRTVEFSVQNGKLTVKSAILRMGELLGVKVWSDGEALSFSSPLYEVIAFNFKKGRVHVSLCDGEDTLITRDVTQTPDKLKGTVTAMLFEMHTEFRETLIEAFSTCVKEFAFAYIDFDALFLMTRYLGYDTSFFDYVPFFRGTVQIHPLFKKRERRLHNAKDLPAIFDRSPLPKRKAIRRIMFSKPGFFFYLDEICKMYEILGNYDVFTSFLSNGVAFKVLSTLNRFPVIEEYLRLICRVNPQNRIKVISGNADLLSSRGLEYAALSEPMKKRYEKRMIERGENTRFQGIETRASLPIVRESKIYDTVIDGFDFRLLKSTNEYIRAGRELSNCLGDTAMAEMMRVVGVMKDGRFVAAIEIGGETGYIVQMRGYKNRDVESPPLLDAIEKWRDTFGIEKGGFDFIGDFEDDGEFPF